MYYVKRMSSSFRSEINEQNPEVSACEFREEWNGFKEYVRSIGVF